MIYNITSKANEKIKFIKDLNDTKTRNKEKLFIVEGFHLVEMAIAKNVVKTLVCLKPYPNCDESIEQLIVSEEILQKLCSTKTPQGILAVCTMNEEDNISLNDKVLYLDDVQDPGNLGTIIRTALAFNFTDVILTEGCCSIYNSKAIAASQGAIFYCRFLHGNCETLKQLKENGYQIVVTNLRNSVSLREYTPQKRQVIVMGNEAHGVHDDVSNIATINVRIDINGIDSLNVGVAAGIMMHDANQRTE